MPNVPSQSDRAEPSLPEALLAALDDVDDARSRRAFAWMSVLGLASPESVAPVLPAIAARLFDGAVSVDRRCDLATAVASLSASSAAWTGELVDHLSSNHEDDRAVAACALAAPRHLEAVPALLRAMADSSSSARTRVAAADALAAIGDASAAFDIVGLLDDPEASVRKAAVVALRVLDTSKRQAPTFLRMSADADVDVRCAALTALLVIGGAPACAAARAALSDAAPAARALAVVVLARHGTTKDAARIAALKDDVDARVRRAVREAGAAAVA